MRREKPPAVCPRCGSSRTVRLIWWCAYLCGEDEKDVKAGSAIVVSPQLARSCERWQALMRHHAGELPLRACLACNPGWSDVHQMAMQDYRRQIEKEDAVRAMQIDEAAELLHAQRRDRNLLVEAVARLLDEVDPSRR
jgi:hypothetical protein